MTEALEKQGVIALDKTTPKWQVTMTQLTIIYRLLECSEKIPLITENTSYEFIKELLDGMHARDLLDIADDNQHWVATKKAEELRNGMVEMYDHTLKFEIFGDVALAMTPDENIANDEGDVLDRCYDPRFGPFEVLAAELETFEEERGVEDIRIAMIRYLSEYAHEKAPDKADPIDPHMIVFIQMLAEGKLKHDIWFDLRVGSFFGNVEKIVSSMYDWEDAGDSEDEASDAMDAIYTAGMLEQRKRDGYECSACQSPLAIFEFNAQREGNKLTECPNEDCGASYEPPEPEGGGYECPSCQTTVGNSQSVCGGCGASLDFSMPEGTISTTETVSETTVIEEEEVWGGYYGYDPYPYYDPYDPYLDAVVFAGCVGVVGAACFYW